LISESGSVADDAGTVKFGSGAGSSEGETTILPNQTNRATGPTTVLSTPTSSTAGSLTKPKSSRNKIIVVVILTAVVAAISAMVVSFYRARSTRKSIESIAVMPFVNASGNAEIDYLSDGMTETLIKS